MSQQSNSQADEQQKKLDATILLDDTQSQASGKASSQDATIGSQSDTDRNPFGDSQATSGSSQYHTGQESLPTSQITSGQDSTLSQLDRTINLHESEPSTQEADESWLHYDSQKWRYLYSTQQLENSQSSNDGQQPWTSTQEKKKDEEKSDEDN
jgi:hypothetical protein